MSPYLHRLTAKAAASPGRIAVIVTVVAAASAVLVPYRSHAKAEAAIEAPVVPIGKVLATAADASGVGPAPVGRA